ncbi:stage III sporulation protein AA [Alteribacter natronophilus]|uniref:stage III sporulation protein AA n=1 Tax=Alteribacter natronophilus TaxID=2583810 RepID=UPI00110E18DF|nr:stage III sporulation protein AA [Alteribacter natronophilus]TMW73758.1 stage III sporulation protein AA [Alteribacter natronophilus]
MKEVFDVLPDTLKRLLAGVPEQVRDKVEEIRIRIGRPLEIMTAQKAFLLPYGAEKPYTVTAEDGAFVLSYLSGHSVYRLEEELKRGYITIPGGHRVGLAGRVVTEKGSVKGIRDIGSFNIRIARQSVGAAEPYLDRLTGLGGWKHTLIAGPPKTGKTTLLRDIARIASQGCYERKLPPCTVGIVDERSELAGCVEGVPQHEFGYRVDVLDRCPKAEGMMMLIRSMSPDIIVVDELGRPEDAEAVMEAVHAGVTVIASVHGSGINDVRGRPTLRQLFEQEAFVQYIELTGQSRFREGSRTGAGKDARSGGLKVRVK